MRNNDVIAKVIVDDPAAIDLSVGTEDPRVDDLIDEFSGGVVATLRLDARA
ncbi:hypothetical protein ACLQ3C_06200 [Gordonia sp. DT30]|uniref:hypothetical protein n=1 Tax=unclassified Gordonia (in: high G+C Gram-positive bacteria) TaxID=2657482 RepID=UPI003CF42BD9